MTADLQDPLRPLRTGWAFGFFNATNWMIVLGPPLVLLAQQMGASTLQVGLIYSAVFLLLPVQIISTAVLPRLGYKRQALLGWVTRIFFLIIPLVLIVQKPAGSGGWPVYWLMLAMFGFCSARSFGAAALMPWLYAIIPPAHQGRYFATDQSISGVGAILALGLCILLFYLLEPYDAFFWQYIAATTGALLSLYFMFRLPNGGKPKLISLRTVFTQSPRILFATPRIRYYFIIHLLAGLVGLAFTPFTTFYLKAVRGMEDSLVLIYASCAMVGTIGGAWVLRTISDSISVRTQTRVFCLFQWVVVAWWLAYLLGPDGIVYSLPLAYLLSGVAASFWVNAHLKYLPQLAAEEDRPLTISVFSASVGFIGGFFPILWGAVLKTEDADLAMNLPAFVGYFLVSVIIYGILYRMLGRLEEMDVDHTALNSHWSWYRPHRYVAKLINLVEPKQ